MWFDVITEKPNAKMPISSQIITVAFDAMPNSLLKLKRLRHDVSSGLLAFELAIAEWQEKATTERDLAKLDQLKLHLILFKQIKEHFIEKILSDQFISALEDYSSHLTLDNQ